MLKAYAEDQEYLNSIKTKDFVPIPSVKVDLEERDSLVENTKLQKNDLQILIIKVEGINGTAELKMSIILMCSRLMRVSAALTIC
jgi:hypothetical protein